MYIHILKFQNGYVAMETEQGYKISTLECFVLDKTALRHDYKSQLGGWV